MQPLKTQFRDELTNFEPPEREPSLLEFSFILDSRCTQPMIIYSTVSGRAFPRFRRAAPRRDVEAELADYIERMAGTEFDLDPVLEAASIEHIVSTDGE